MCANGHQGSPESSPMVCILWIRTHAKLAVTWTDCTIYESDRRNFISIELLPSNCPSLPFVPAFLLRARFVYYSYWPLLSVYRVDDTDTPINNTYDNIDMSHLREQGKKEIGFLINFFLINR